jgi:hypothetical protein
MERLTEYFDTKLLQYEVFMENQKALMVRIEMPGECMK